MRDLPLLSLTTFLPIIGVLFIFRLRGAAEDVANNARWIALWTSLATFLLSVYLCGSSTLAIGRFPVRRARTLGCRSTTSPIT